MITLNFVRFYGPCESPKPLIGNVDIWNVLAPICIDFGNVTRVSKLAVSP
jgi:hypothetical protein